MLKKQVLEKRSKALVVYGAGHLFKADGSTNLFSSTGGGITKTLKTDYPGRMFVVITLGGSGREYEKFESALKTPVRPVLIPLQELPFRDFTAEEFIGSKLLKRLPIRQITAIDRAIREIGRGIAPEDFPSAES